MQRDDTIILYAIPAYGHINSVLYLARQLSETGFHLVFYAVEEFRILIESNGCEFRNYPLGPEPIDLSDGGRLLKLYRLILEHTCDMGDRLVSAAKTLRPCAVIFDSLALWGRLVAFQLHVPAFSFYSVVSAGRIGSPGFWEYMRGFSLGSLRYAGELPGALRCRGILREKYRLSGLGLLDVLMNRGDWNLMGCSRLFQPGGDEFHGHWIFLGQTSSFRVDTRKNDFELPKSPVIYVSFGTIFCMDIPLYRELVKQFGGSDYHIVVISGGSDILPSPPENFTVRPWVNQEELLKRSSLFITAGGINSLHEALRCGAPCLMCPKQGEQRLNARRFEQLGFGRILRKPADLRRQAMAVMAQKNTWDEEKRQSLLEVHVGEAVSLFCRICRGEE